MTTAPATPQGLGSGLAPLPPSEWPDSMATALLALRPAVARHPVPPPGGRPDKPKAFGILGTFAHHPDLARAWLGFNGHVLYGTTLTQRQREILVLRAAAVLESPYTWSQHVLKKDEADLDADDIGRIAFGPTAPGLDPVERALIIAVDELLNGGRISAETGALLAQHLDGQQILDVLFTVGCYTTLSWLHDTVGLVTETELAAGGS